MTNLTIPQTSIDRLLQLEVGEEGAIIVPINHKIMAMKGDIPCVLTFEQEAIPISNFSPLQPNEEFYVGEEFYENESIFYKNERWSKDLFLVPNSSQMTPEQSRFHGVCVDVEARCLQPEYGYNNTIDLYNQHNELHNTNIEPSLDDYVFYITIRRTK